MGRSKRSHRVKGRNTLLKRNRLIIISAAPATTSPPCTIKGLSSHLTNQHFNHALRLKMLLAYFLYLLITPFVILYKTEGVLKQTATYSEGNARHKPCTACQRTPDITHYTFSLTEYPVILGNVSH